MCGIFGVIRVGGLNRADRWIARGMADALASRGPDGEGFHVEPDVVLGMRRLSIIDLAGGWQPLYSEDRSIVLVANGEIYNYLELREELVLRGHRFSSDSDSETIVHLYEEFGDRCVDFLRGMFSFAIVDLRQRRVLLVRDRMGEKPLYYSEAGGRFVFSSELGGLIGSGAVPFDLSYAAIKQYFYWGFITEPECAVQGVHKLDAGTMVSVDLMTGSQTFSRYWDLTAAPMIHDEPVDRIRHEIEKIGRIVFRSDVPISIGLSGGIDSSAVAMLALQNSTQPVRGICIGYEGVSWQDERAMARQFASRVGLSLDEVVLTDDQMVLDFPEMCVRRDDPINDLSGSGFFALYRASRQSGMPVMFGGHGGDELFWGYPWTRSAIAQSIRKSRLLSGRANIFDYIRITAPPVSVTRGIDWLFGGAGALAGVKEWKRDRKSAPDQLVFWDMHNDFQDAETGLGTVAGEALRTCKSNPAGVFTGASNWESLDIAMTGLLCKTFLQSNGFILCDRLSMAMSVEGRLPFADYRLAEVVVGLRKVQSDSGLDCKYWLKSALHGLVPEFVFSRRKRGFSAPWRRWSGRLFGTYGGDLCDGVLVGRGVINRKAAEGLRSPTSWLGQPRPFSMAALVLEQWARGMSTLAQGAERYKSRAAEESEPALPTVGPNNTFRGQA